MVEELEAEASVVVTLESADLSVWETAVAAESVEAFVSDSGFLGGSVRGG